MKLYRQGSHTVFDLKYHLVWTTKYRKPILTGSIGKRVRDLIREICATHSITIIRGHVSKEHIHIFISMPPQISVSKIAQYIKGKTARKILQENPTSTSGSGAVTSGHAGSSAPPQALSPTKW